MSYAMDLEKRLATFLQSLKYVFHWNYTRLHKHSSAKDIVLIKDEIQAQALLSRVIFLLLIK